MGGWANNRGRPVLRMRLFFVHRTESTLPSINEGSQARVYDAPVVGLTTKIARMPFAFSRLRTEPTAQEDRKIDSAGRARRS